jgi:hypothetical protein
LFALADNASGEILDEQIVAAAWHDVGYLKQDRQNEPVAVAMFMESNAFKTISEEKRDEIISNILDTQVVMKDKIPRLSADRSFHKYMLDADVSNFGREDFFEKGRMLAEEMGLDLSDKDVKRSFYKFSIELLKNYEWKTVSARALRQAQMDKNLMRLEAEYEKIG